MKQIKHITFILSGITKGGSERVVSILANNYSRNGISVNVISMQNLGCYYSFNEKVEITYLNEDSNGYKNPFKIFKNVLKLNKCLLKEKTDIVISFGESTSIYSIFSKFFTNLKTVVCIRQNPNGVNKYIIKLVTIFYRFADLIILQTSFQKKWSDKKWPNLKKAILNNPLELKSNENNYKNREHSIDFLFPATIKWEKNHHELILAFDHIKDRLPNSAKMYFAGRFFTKEIEDSINSLIASLNLGDRIVIMGNVEDIDSIYKKTKIFVMSSTNEGMPNAMLESMAYGIPCITTNWHGVDSIIQNNYNGIIVPIGQPEELGNEMLKMYYDENLRNLIGNQSFKEIHMKYDANIVSNDWLEVLSNI